MFPSLIQECRLRNYSPKTVKAYSHYNHHFLKFCSKKPRQVKANDLRNYLLYLDSKRASSSQINLAHNSINFYYKNILQRNFKKIPFQKREDRVKPVLNKNEIKGLIDAAKNMKHKLIMSLLYASGVRVTELVNIKLDHLDLEEKRLLVSQGKGKKDRYTILSEGVVEGIKSYLAERKEKTDYLFPGRREIGHLSIRTIQEILRQAAQKSKTLRKATPHRLRHSFATHLMEAGTKDSQLQKLLGHKDIRTTQQYARVANKHLLGIKSPHDQL